MPNIDVQAKEMLNGDKVISYTNTVGPAQETFTFPTSQETVILSNKGTKNIHYIIGPNTGTLLPSEHIKLIGSFSSVTLSSQSGTQHFAIWAEAAGESSHALGKNRHGAFQIGERSFIHEVEGDLWFTVNAYFDGANWMRVDTTKIAFAYHVQGYGSIAFETVQGINFWKASPGENPIGSFGAAGGWEIAMLFTGHSNTVIGGMNFEIDGSGASPEFGRINQLADGTYFSRNCYWDGTRFVHDKVIQPAVAIRIHNRTGELDLLLAPKGSDVDIPYDGSGSNQPAVEFETVPIWHDRSTARRSAVNGTQLSPQSLTAGGWLALAFNNVRFDHLGEYDGTTGKFTAQEDGIYLVSTSVGFVSMPATGKVLLTLSVNGAEYARLADMQIGTTGSDFSLNGSGTLKLNKGDYFYVYAHSSQALTTIAGDIRTHVEITRIA